MNFQEVNNYNLKITLLGGQAFNWDFIEGNYYGFFNNKLVQIKWGENGFFWQTYPKKDDFEFLNKYLNLDSSYEIKIENLKKKDLIINKAISRFDGLHVLNQDFEQTLLSFILSSNKSVKGVRRAVRNLSEKYGESIDINNLKFYLFPTINRLSELSENDFKSLGFGYRAKYFVNAVDKLKTNFALPEDEIETRTFLTSFIGIGDKVADCIMAFSLGFNNVTPLDVWGMRVLKDYYRVDSKLSYKSMREWYQDYFQENTSLAGQFLFEDIRSAKIS
jgi:N-glycosylase/DNA lyase